MFWITIRLGRHHTSWPFFRPLTSADADLDAVIHQEPQHSVDQTEFVEQVEDQPDHGLHLLVGILGDVPVGKPETAHWQGHGELAAAGLAHPSVHIRCLIRCSSASLIVPFSPRSMRSLCSAGS